MLLILIIARSNQIRVYLYFKVSICIRYFNTELFTKLVLLEGKYFLLSQVTYPYLN